MWFYNTKLYALHISEEKVSHDSKLLSVGSLLAILCLSVVICLVGYGIAQMLYFIRITDLASKPDEDLQKLNLTPTEWKHVKSVLLMNDITNMPKKAVYDRVCTPKEITTPPTNSPAN